MKKCREGREGGLLMGFVLLVSALKTLVLGEQDWKSKALTGGTGL